MNNSIQKDLQQPLQAFYFSKDGNLQSYFTNCYAGGFPYLKWNRNDNFNNFPPATMAPVYEDIMLYDIVKYFEPLNSDYDIQQITGKYDYVIIVFWNYFMRRHAKRLIKYVQNNCKMQNAVIIYVNNDNYWIEKF